MVTSRTIQRLGTFQLVDLSLQSAMTFAAISKSCWRRASICPCSALGVRTPRICMLRRQPSPFRPCSEAKDSGGQAPPPWAAGSGHEVCVRLLAEKGADFEAKEECGQTPLSYAAKTRHLR